MSSSGTGATRHPGRARQRAAEAGALAHVEPLILAICHEVGNLLAAARLSAHLVGRDHRPSEAALSPTEIEELAAHAGALLAHVRPLLTGRPSRARVAPSQILGALERALEDLPRKGVVVQVRVPRGLPDAWVDPDALHHALLTIVLGAIEAARPRGRVSISARRVPGGLVFQVEDDGRPFEPEAPARRGRALALVIAGAVAEQNGGAVTVHRRRKGTRVEVRAAGVPASARRLSGARRDRRPAPAAAPR